MSTALINSITYFLSEHPYIVGFRWSNSQSWGSTWSFLFTSISLYIAVSSSLHILLSAVRRSNRSVPLGHIPEIHSLLMSILSATIFAGILLSAAAEIRDTRWLWRRSKTATPLQWLLCFPLGTLPLVVSSFGHTCFTSRAFSTCSVRFSPFYVAGGSPCLSSFVTPSWPSRLSSG